MEAKLHGEIEQKFKQKVEIFSATNSAPKSEQKVDKEIW